MCPLCQLNKIMKVPSRAAGCCKRDKEEAPAAEVLLLHTPEWRLAALLSARLPTARNSAGNVRKW